MNIAASLSAEQAADRFARRITARLSEHNDFLAYDISERLRAGRERALSERRREVQVLQRATATTVQHQGGVASLGGPGRQGWWRSALTAAPLVGLAISLAVFITSQTDFGSHEVAEVDAALLTDDLPPSAYADPGFVQFIQTAPAVSTL
jgi:hypothetical protein